MSTRKLVGSGLLATAGALALGSTAFAGQGRYTHAPNVYEYESSPTCGQACYAPAPAYGYQAPVYYQESLPPLPTLPQSSYHQAPPVYVDCMQLGTCSGSTHYGGATSTYSHETADCPSGTTLQPDGTCLQGGGYSGSTYTGPISSGSVGYSSGYSSGSSYSSSVADCPSGTSRQPDGTCMQNSGTSYSSYSSGSSSASSYSSATTTLPCPAGTTMSADGTCRSQASSFSSSTVSSDHSGASSYAGSSVEIYSGDASTSASSSASSSGYSTNAYSSSDYRPIRK